jgi:hypothetical protein
MPEAIEMRPEGVELEVNDDMTKALEAAVSPEEIKQIIAQEAAKQNIVIPRDNKGRFVPVAEKKETAPADKKDDETFVYSDDFSIGGKDYHFEGDSPADINRQVKAAIAAHENATKPVQQQTATVDGAKAKQDELLALQLDVMSGKITMDEYIVKSGAVDKYLQSKGINTSELKELVDEKKNAKEVGSWEAATAEFLKLEGNDWPGGDQNLKVMGYKLAELGLNGKPSADSLQKAYDAMKADNMVFAVAPPAEEPKLKKKAASSSAFGVSGGDSRRDAAQVHTSAVVPTITPDMSPRDIMEAFKAAAQAQGIHPDELIRQAQR